jgi:hypothetical protein
MKKWQRATKNEIDSILLRIGQVQEQMELFQDIYDSDGNIVPIENLSKTNELTGAGIEYITSVAEHLYTHFKKDIDRSNSKYDELPGLEWNGFLQIASGGIKGQVDRIERTVMQYQSKPKTVFMIDMDGHLHTRWPFVLDFEWEGAGKLDAKQAARFARLNSPTKKQGGKPKPEKIDEITGEIIPRLPIKNITIMAAKPLFEAFFKKGSNYSFPTGMYAKFFDIANTMKRNRVKTNETSIMKRGTDLLDTDINVSAYARYARYIMRHNNLTATDMKNKKFKCVIKLPALEFLKSVYPSLISINGRREQHFEREKFTYFMGNAQIIYLSIEDFKIYPTFTGIEIKDGLVYFVWTLYTDREKAREEAYTVAQRIIKRGTGRL